MGGLTDHPFCPIFSRRKRLPAREMHEEAESGAADADGREAR